MKLQDVIGSIGVAVAIYDGPDHVVRVSNARHEEMTGGRLTLGLPLLHCLPELAGQPAFLSLEAVYATGEDRSTREVPVTLLRDGRFQDCWFDLTWSPIRNEQGAVTGVIVCAFEVTAHVLAMREAHAAQRAASSAERLTMAITDNASLGLVMMDARQHCTFLNPAAERILGLTLAEVVRRDAPLHDLVHHTRPDGRPFPMSECPIDRALPTRLREHGEDVFVRPDGTFYPVAFTASPIFEDDVAVGTVIELEDISARRAMEDALRTEVERTRAIAENAASCLFLHDARGYVSYLNAAAQRVTGYTLAELRDKPLHDYIHHSHADGRPYPMRECPVARVYSEGLTLREEPDVFFRKDGTSFPVSYSVTPLRQGARIIGSVLEFRDVTVEDAARRSLSDSERLFREVFENLPELAWSAQPNGHIEFYNRRWYDYTGTTHAQMVGWGWKQVHRPDMLERVTAAWTHSLETGTPLEMEFPLRAADGSFRWFLTRVQPLRDSSGRIVRWFGTNTDIDDQRRAREDRERAVELLQRTLQVREDFLAIASHELRTPLTALNLNLQLVARQVRGGTLDPAQLPPKMEAIEKQAQRLTRLVGGLLEVSHLDSGRLSLEYEDTDLVELVRDVVDRHAVEAGEAGSPIHFEPTGPVAGRFDRRRLDQVVANLVTNALKYGSRRAIVVTVAAEGDDAVVRVTDQGIGVAAGDQERIFERFERAASSRHFGGFGLGLYISRQIVALHGGRIDVESVTGSGSTFTVRVPRRPPAVPLGDVASAGR